MREHEIRDWLAGTEVTDEQMEQLSDAAGLAARFEDDADGAEQAFSVMAQLILGDETVDGLADQMRSAELAAAAARDALYAGIVWAAGQGESELSLAGRSGVSRTTVRKLLGK